jgi:3-deoxy-D-manno-octulosonate 8-phosphate phosphatase (KDO 8-P phosphatase)
MAMPTIRLLVLDVDGVLTDGGIMLADDGQEIKRFCAADGVGLRAWARVGLRSAIITGRRGDALMHRLSDLGVSEVIQGSSDKGASLALLEQRTGVPRGEMAYVGDDWPDLPIMRAVGYAIAPANADARVKAVARHVTPRAGGQGAVRDAVEHLLSGLGLLERAVALYDGTNG